MAKQVAFLRAINVGGRVVKMERLREIFTAGGLAGVETFIASGNVVFDAPRAGATLEAKLEKALQTALGYRVATFIRSLPDLARIIAASPFDEEGTLYIGFFASPPSAAAVGKLQERATATDSFHVEGRELFWLTRAKISESPLSGPLLERTLGLETTLRNVNTVNRLLAKYGSASG